jgi:diguanylate cyclase (GGDEF)-like protein/PAS domain S-box-containing protein
MAILRRALHAQRQQESLRGAAGPVTLTPRQVEPMTGGTAQDLSGQSIECPLTQALRESNARFRQLFEKNTSIMLLIEPVSGEVRAANEAASRFYGYPRTVLVGMPVSRINTRSAQLTAQEMQRAVREERNHFVFQHRLASGELRDVEVHATPIASGGESLLFSIVHDITERRRAEEQLRIAAAAFETQDSMVVTDARGIVLRVNRAFTASTGYTEQDIVGQTPALLQSGRHTPAFYRSMWRSIRRSGGWNGEIWDRRKNGEVYPKWLTIGAVRDEEGRVTHYIGTHQDISERKQAEEKIRELAYSDPLTGLPNRTLLLDRSQQAMAASARSGARGALLFIDLDNFKTLNDTHGHDTGDRLLKLVAQRLTDCVREGDTVARLGGDEFVVLLNALGEGEVEAAKATEAVAEKVLACLNQPCSFDTGNYLSTASIGATVFAGNQVSMDELMRQSDLAMYKAKDAGRNTLRFFDAVMERAVRERAELENDLRQGLAAQQFLLHYQAQVTHKGQVTGAEALLRWQHPERGLVGPAEFIPMAEETGLILPLGTWVLETACTQLALWAKDPATAHLTVAVNVSARQFQQADFVQQVLAVLSETGANAQRLKLELTESLLVANMEEVVGKMGALKAWGVGFSLDDFGTGYSSLSYLRRLPLDQLKIDQSFVRDVLTDGNAAVIARTIVTLAQSLGLGVIAEGVETAEQRDFLARSGCHAYQGYLFSRPMAVAEFEAIAQTRQSAY